MFLALGDNFDAEPRERVLDPSDGALVSGYLLRREDNRVSVLQGNIPVIVHRDPRQRRTIFSLATGREDQNIFAGEIADIPGIDEFRTIAQIAAFPRNIRNPQQGPPDEAYAAVRCDTSHDGAFKPGDVGGEHRDHHPTRLGGNDIGERSPVPALPSLWFRARKH